MIDSWICSPERMKLFQGKKRGKGCLFCKIAKNDGSAESLVLRNDGRFMAIMNIYPYNTGHVMVMPTRHVTSVEGMEDGEVAEMFGLVKKVVKLLKKTISPIGFNIGLNQGVGTAGASIHHLHVHVVPRFKTDYGFIDIIGGTKVLPECVKDTYRKLKKHTKMLE